jgi:tuberous sclerosis 2
MPPQQDADNSTRSRPRANTTTFTFPSWRRGRPDAAPPVPAILPAPSLSFEALIEALKPPAVPSLSHARSLANLLATRTPLPRPTALNPVLAALCGKDTPPALQVAGFDIMTAYWENSEAAINLGTADRLSYFSLFLGAHTAWSSETWEARFKALRALTSSGAEAVGMEAQVLVLLMSWIKGAFEGLLSYELAERAERQRSIEALAASVTSIAENVEIVARIPGQQLAAVLEFYADLVERALDLPANFTTQAALSSNQSIDTRGSPVSTPSKPSTHRRHPSSLSIPAMNLPPAPPPLKHPADLMVTVYINHLNSQLKTSAPSHLQLILPLLFRALAFYTSPLPRLSITSEAQTSPPLEKKLTDTITSLFGGPFAASCGIILKRHLFPPQNINENLKASIQVSTGAHRSFRNFVRQRLHIRIARAFINRESSANYGPSGAPGHIDMERDVMERAWPKDDVQGWDTDRLGNTICRSVEAWADLANPNPIDYDELSVGREKILDEVAGILKDVFQEFDMRDDDTPMDDAAAGAVGETLYRLATYVRSVKCVLFNKRT